MFIGRIFGRQRRWVAGGNISFLWVLMYLLIGGFVIYTQVVGHTP